MAVTLLLCSACELKFKPNEEAEAAVLSVQRYDRLESRYLTTGDFSALQQMNTDYPIETRTLIEKMLQLGTITDANISNRFLMFYQESTLQALIADAEAEYANMDDINQQLKESFERLNAWMPELQQPSFYAQIGALDQSIVVGELALQGIAVKIDNLAIFSIGIKNKLGCRHREGLLHHQEHRGREAPCPCHWRVDERQAQPRCYLEEGYCTLW